jgi:hypothetical protein
MIEVTFHNRSKVEIKQDLELSMDERKNILRKEVVAALTAPEGMVVTIIKNSPDGKHTFHIRYKLSSVSEERQTYRLAISDIDRPDLPEIGYYELTLATETITKDKVKDSYETLYINDKSHEKTGMHPEYQKSGIVRHGLPLLIEWARSLECQAVTGLIIKGNEAAIRGRKEAIDLETGQSFEATTEFVFDPNIPLGFALLVTWI